ncbi:hypothetical protein C8J57DRAFT_1228046 [Mycena rebaudengoi]|nr:hypothetical protein C8J57DRAFT_1228046 [Mycena rebaudengoi]
MSRGVSQADKIFLAMKSGRITMEGVLQEMNLPPMKKAKISASNVAYARQQATIVGLGAESFDKAVEQIAKIAYEVELAFEDSDVLAWTAQDASVDGTHLQATCCYFTTGKEPPTNQVVDFTKHVVPAGVLSRMLSKGMYHCIDNEVLYLDLEGDKLINKNPSGFQVGDIVELGLSVIAFKGPRDGKAVIKLVVPSLVFLDGTHTRDAKIAQRIAEAKAKAKKPNRRRQGHGESQGGAGVWWSRRGGAGWVAVPVREHVFQWEPAQPHEGPKLNAIDIEDGAGRDRGT